MKRGKFILFLILLFVLPFLYGQEDFRDAPVMEGEGITIVGTPETTQQMKIVTKEEIEKIHPVDLADLLTETVGLGAARYGTYGNAADITMRGFDTERIAVLIDGIPANSLRSGEFDFNSVDVNSIERIEVIYGGSDTKYNVSGALGGVINIVTVKKEEPGFRFGGSVSNTGTLPGRYNRQYGGVENPQWRDLADTQNISLFGAYGAENYSLRAALYGNRAGNHFLYQDYYGYARRKEGNEVNDIGGSVSWIRELPDYAKLILCGDIYYGNKNVPHSGYTREAGEQRDFSTRQNIMLEMPRIFRDDFSMELSFSHNWQTLDYDPGRNPSLHRERGLVAINRWSWYALEQLTLRTGGDYRYTHLDSTNDGIHNGHSGGMYFTVEYAPVKQFLLIPSIKAVTNGSRPVPVPKLGLLWLIGESLTLKNNYFRVFKFPDFDDLYWKQAGFSGNPDLKPEDGWGGDLGLDYHPKPWLSLEEVFYTTWTKDSIHWNYANGSWEPRNIGEAWFFGLDSRASFEIPLSFRRVKKIIPGVFYQYQLSYLLSGDLDFASNKRIPYMPAHTFGFSLEIPWNEDSAKEGSLLVSGRYESNRYADMENLVKLDPHFLLSITVNQAITKNLSAFAAVRNILNRHYESFAEYPMPGISLTLGLKAVFEPKQKEKE
ncbi:MAG: TonB-dependent receptor [Treponema sp.]|jgi:vitamin B12 transporter|nr:TonB-dependent receptor [Treponema sp.]